MAGFHTDLDGAKIQQHVVEADLKRARSKIAKYFDAFEAAAARPARVEVRRQVADLASIVQ